jgi:hypothetical protein
MANRYEIERLMVSRDAQQGLHPGVLESADGYGPQTHGYGLQQKILGSVPCFEVDITRAPLRTILLDCTLIHRSQDEYGWRLAHGVLLQRSGVQRWAEIVLTDAPQLVLRGIVGKESLRRGHIEFQWVQRPG